MKMVRKRRGDVSKKFVNPLHNARWDQTHFSQRLRNNNQPVVVMKGERRDWKFPIC